MGRKEIIDVYIYTGLPDKKKEDFVQRIKIRNPNDIIGAICECSSVITQL
jgi:hypothetical protein